MGKVLIVDDSIDTCKVLAAFLSHGGHRTTYVTSCKAALEKLQDDLPDVMILDLMMPCENGIDLLRRIRDDSRTADSLAADVSLSPSAIARRLRRLRGEGWIARTIALLAPRLTRGRLRAIVFIQLSEHADQSGKARLLQRIGDAYRDVELIIHG